VPIRLLLIEDNPGDAVIFREKIGASDLDAALVHVPRLADGLEALKGSAFDLLLVDLSLPDSHGLSSVEQVRKAAPHLPLIVLTGLDDAAVAAEAKKRGAVDYLVKWYVDSVSLARYIRYAIEQYRLYGDEMQAVVPTPTEPAPRPEAAPDGPPEAPAASGAEAETAPSSRVDADTLLHATEAALRYVEESVDRGRHLEGTLRAAVELFRQAEDGAASATETHDVLPLLRHAVERRRDRAQRNGVPLRVTSGRKKVLAQADRLVLGRYLDRLVDLALATTHGEGLQLAVETERDRALLVATWPVRRGVDLTDPDADPLLGLDLILCRRLATRAGGSFTFAAANAQCEATLALRARDDA